MKQLPNLVGVLGAPGGSVAIMIQRYYVPGPKEGVRFLDSQFKTSFQDYRKLSEDAMKIDASAVGLFAHRIRHAPRTGEGNSTVRCRSGRSRAAGWQVVGVARERKGRNV